MNQTSVWLAANFNAPEDGVIGYRLYAKQRVAGATSASTGWQFQGESTTPTWADGTGCDTYIDYRVTAIRKLTPASADTVESLPSMPIRVKTPACP